MAYFCCLKYEKHSYKNYKVGKNKTVAFLVGQTMKETKGKANPQMLNKMFLD